MKIQTIRKELVNHNSFGVIQFGGFEPIDISGCVLWFRSDLGITKDGGNLVSSWADQSGNGHDISQAVGAKQPVWTAAQINGHASLVLDGADDMLVSSNVFAWARPNTVYIVLKQISWTGSDFIYDGKAADAGMGLFQFDIAPKLSLHDGNPLIMTDELAVGSWGIVSTIHNGDNSFIKLNGGVPVGGAGGNNLPGGFTLGRIGSTDALYSNISVAEILGYNAVSSGDDTLILGYLNGRYAIY